MMTCPAVAVELVKEEEGFRPRAYRCAAGQWTIGYGHTGPDVYEGLTITEARAEELLRADLRAAERDVCNLTGTVRPELTEGQFGALVSFVYNVGARAFERSRLLSKLREGDTRGAAEEFRLWTKARHPTTGELRVLPGLVRRRARERALFLEAPPPQVEVAFATPSPELAEFVPIAPPEGPAQDVGL